MKQVIEVGRGADAPSRVVIGDAINSLENYLPSGRKVVIVTDPNVHRLYKEIINRYDYCLIGLGEPNKTLGTAGKLYGELLARCAAEELGGQFDTVTWVPVSKKREHERGYDQAHLLAKETARHWGIEPVRLLRKTTRFYIEERPLYSGRWLRKRNCRASIYLLSRNKKIERLYRSTDLSG